jgi:hypothetical protein
MRSHQAWWAEAGAIGLLIEAGFLSQTVCACTDVFRLVGLANSVSTGNDGRPFQMVSTNVPLDELFIANGHGNQRRQMEGVPIVVSSDLSTSRAAR